MGSAGKNYEQYCRRPKRCTWCSKISSSIRGINEAYGGRVRVCISICLHTSPSDGYSARNQEFGRGVDSSMGRAWLFKWPVCASHRHQLLPQWCTNLRKAKCQCGLLTPNRPKPDLLALRARSSPLEEMALGQRCWSKHELGI